MWRGVSLLWAKAAIRRVIFDVRFAAGSIESPQHMDRQALLAAAVFLSIEPPALPAAIAEINEEMAHAFRGRRVERRPESGLLAACAKLLHVSC